MMTKLETMKRFIMQPASSSYPALGNAYTRPGYQIEYSPSLVLTGKNYYASKAGITDGSRMSTAAEELAIQLRLERAGKDPREAGVFDDLFGRNGWSAWQWTETGLRVPNGRDPTKYETDGQGRKYWAREVLIGDKVAGEILVPEGSGRVAVEWDEVFGLPRVTENGASRKPMYTTHFWFKAEPGKDNTSDHYDVAVGRRSNWLPDRVEMCFDVAANYARSNVGSADSFRPVRGSSPKIEK